VPIPGAPRPPSKDRRQGGEHLEEHSYREIADVLGISETNVATKINRLKQRIRQDFNQTTSH